MSVILAGFGSFWLVPRFSKYDILHFLHGEVKLSGRCVNFLRPDVFIAFRDKKVTIFRL